MVGPETKVLLLGAQGMLGQALQHALRDAQLTCWDQPQLDITNEKAVREKIAEQRPDIIINVAAFTAVDQAESERDKAFAVNSEAVGHVASVAATIGATVVHYSTDYVFPGTKEEGYAEGDEPGPAVNVYGESKLAGERKLRESGATYFLIRTAWLYGQGGKNFVDTMLKLGLKRQELKVVNDQHGCPTYTADLAAATRQLLSGTYQPGIYHLVNGGHTTWFEFAQAIFKQANLPVTVTSIPASEYPLPAKRPTYSILKNSHGPRLRPWRDALDEYLKAH